jgi:hypothetical protein
VPNPQQPELARSRKSDAVTDDALPTKAKKRTKKGATLDAVGPIPEENLPGHQPDVIPDKPMVPPDPYRVRPAGEEVRGPTAGPDDDVQRESSVTFDFLFDRLFVPFAAPLGVLPQTTSLVLDDDELFVRFGPWTLRTTRDNIAGCEVTGPYRFVRVAGGPHLSLKDRGVTFATNRRSGACIRFREPVTGLLPWGLLRHPAATVTVTNPHDLARRLNADGG